MANSPKRVYWDACTWIDLLQNERIADENGRIVQDRATMCKAVIHQAATGSIEIVTSALSLVEVCKHPRVRSDSPDLIAEYFENDFVILANLDRFSGERARELMLAGYSKLKPPDAAHLATAAITNVEEMHTFDDKLLSLDGFIDRADGIKLKICTPHADGPSLPLLELIAGSTLEGDSSGSDPNEELLDEDLDALNADLEALERAQNNHNSPAIPSKSGRR
ncbi:type II toxin-antitoxin system VapC family toxin [Chelatococcus asaccharovorans]|uniref:Putative nucleic acid-binding protein n=1 Tax=Chelatococcus asaccharovorans TaxID=28210 RepID=A0A2V3U2V8_9HYPH|nr:PIN domain-containing protein [Chelatococcus asaccharovorans]MBS7702700.1 PIN domain-containing protein [Chelatococcus asaccharovorans]PXW56993.1 putative nucleic acid-binding protein [Chelatococcus asaccharovorans]